MAISITPPVSFSPAFLSPIAPPLETARPQIEPVGFNQRAAFIGPANGLEQANETAPAYLRTFTERVNGLNSPDDSPLADLFSSFADRMRDVGQLDLFGAGSVGFQSEQSALSGGLSQYASIQAGNFRPETQSSLSLFA